MSMHKLTAEDRYSYRRGWPRVGGGDDLGVRRGLSGTVKHGPTGSPRVRGRPLPELPEPSTR